MLSQLKAKGLLIGLLIGLLTACSTVPGPDITYSRQSRNQLVQPDRWFFEGRLAISGQNESWSASVQWQHVPGLEEIKLSGPLGQRAAVIRLTGAFVSIDHGDGKLESSEEPEEFVNQQLGVYVPLVSLRYWAFGLPESTHAYMETIDGFSQAGWLISYKQMQIVSGQSLPRKIVASNSDVKLKLVIDQWIISDTKAK